MTGARLNDSPGHAPGADPSSPSRRAAIACLAGPQSLERLARLGRSGKTCRARSLGHSVSCRTQVRNRSAHYEFEASPAVPWVS